MLRFAKYLSAKIDNASRRIVKTIVMGKKDVQKSYEVMPFGVDGKPVEDMRAVHIRTGVKGETAIIGYVNINQQAGDGELRLYSMNSQGDSEQSYMYLKNDGTLELNGNADNLVRFSELQAAYDELRGDLNSMIQTWNTFADAYSPGQGGAPPDAGQTSESTASVDPAKVDSVKTP